MRRDEALRALDEVAGNQAGLVTTAQAVDRGVDRVSQLRLRKAGLLENVGRGVYRLVGAPSPSHLESRVAWLRLDPSRPAWERTGLGTDDGVISHRSACLVHELGDIPAPETELTVPRRRTTREPGVRLYVGRLGREDVTVVNELPVTTVERTIVDLLQDRTDGGHVGGVIADAERRNLVDLDSLANRVAVFAGKYGVPKASRAELLSVLAEQAGQRLDHDNVRRISNLAELAGILEGYRFAFPNNADLDALRTAFTVSTPVAEAIRKLSSSLASPPALETLKRLTISPTLKEAIRKLKLPAVDPLVLTGLQQVAAAALPRTSFTARAGKQQKTTKTSAATTLGKTIREISEHKDGQA